MLEKKTIRLVPDSRSSNWIEQQGVLPQLIFALVYEREIVFLSAQKERARD